MLLSKQPKRIRSISMRSKSDRMFVLAISLTFVAILMSVQITKIDEALQIAQALAEDIEDGYVERQVAVHSYIENQTLADTRQEMIAQR